MKSEMSLIKPGQMKQYQLKWMFFFNFLSIFGIQRYNFWTTTESKMSSKQVWLNISTVEWREINLISQIPTKRAPGRRHLILIGQERASTEKFDINILQLKYNIISHYCYHANSHNIHILIVCGLSIHNHRITRGCAIDQLIYKLSFFLCF